MTENHPITPTLKLFRKWTEYRGTETEDQFWWRIATQAAQWGADCELEKCCEWLKSEGHEYEHEALLASRRPKPPSLKEQALEALGPEPLPETGPTGDTILNKSSIERHRHIRRAIEALPDD
jgi:hypothetical protein